jgi:hypothetical protein
MIKLRGMRWTWHAARIGEKINAYRILEGRPQWRPRRRWVDNIKMDLRDTGRDGMDVIDLAQDMMHQWRALVNTLMNVGGSIKC